MQFGKDTVNIMSTENMLSQFWDLASNQEETRLKAASQLLSSLNEAQNKFEESQAVRKLHTCVRHVQSINQRLYLTSNLLIAKLLIWPIQS